MFFNHLGQGLGDSLKAGATNELGELSEAFRELPDQTLKELVELIRTLSRPTGMSKGKSQVDLPELIARIPSGNPAGQANSEPVPDLDGMKLNNSQLKEILKSFGVKSTTTVAGNLSKVRELARTRAAYVAPVLPSPRRLDPETVDRGVELYNALLADRKLSIPGRSGRVRTVPIVLEGCDRGDLSTRGVYSTGLAGRHRRAIADEPGRNQIESAPGRPNSCRNRLVVP